MTLFGASPTSASTGQLVLAAALAAVGIMLLLPRPRGRSVAAGIAALIAAAAVAGAWIHQAFGEPAVDAIGKFLFIFFSTGAIAFGIVLVVQRNPARGAIAFAFVILSTCGLFLLLAAPFLMAATIIIYAGAIVVTFLFVLMLSAAGGPSDENDRSREPLLGSLAGFAFVGLILFSLSQAYAAATPSPSSAESNDWRRMAPLPTPLITPQEQHDLRRAAEELQKLDDDTFYSKSLTQQERTSTILRIEESLEEPLGLNSAKYETIPRYGSIHRRLAAYRKDRPADDVLRQVEHIRNQCVRTLARFDDAATLNKAEPQLVREESRRLRESLVLLANAGELPARNTANLGLVLYSEHLLSIELAGTLLLVATIGAIAIAHRKAVPR